MTKMKQQHYVTPQGCTARAEVTYIGGTVATIRSINSFIYDGNDTIQIETIHTKNVSLGSGNVRKSVTVERTILQAVDVRSVSIIESLGNIAQSNMTFNIHPNTIVEVNVTTKKNKVSNPNVIKQDVTKTAERLSDEVTKTPQEPRKRTRSRPRVKKDA